MKVYVGDITKVEGIDVIVNAANGLGIMGAGVAGAIARSAGTSSEINGVDFRAIVQSVVEKEGPFDVGDVYISDAGLLKRRKVKKIYHAVTMKYPGGKTSLSIIPTLLKKVFDTAIINGETSIAFGGLGCGIGGLSKSDVAREMAHISEAYNGIIKIEVVDIDQEFIDLFKNNLSIPIEV
jgi:O-acetyl-ADP-ribose deacetylase (regulator of RNase III)